MHPSQLSDLLCDEFGSQNFEPKKVHAYASLMLRVATQKGKHHKRAGNGSIPECSISLPFQYFRKHFGLDGFKQLNEHFGCIGHTPNWNLKESETRAYWITDKGYTLIEEARLSAFDGRPNILLNTEGSPIRRRSNGVYTARDSQGRNAVTDASVRWAIPVNMEAIELAIDAGVQLIFSECTGERLDRVDSAIRSIHACAMNDNIGQGYLPQVYHEVESGRLYGCDDLSLQNVVKEAKQIVLCGAHEYDFSNCHFRLLASAASELGFEPVTIFKYIKDPRLFRQSLADRIGISKKQAKTCLLALLYGATQSLWRGCAIPQAIGPEKACVLYKDPDFDELGLEILEIGDLLRQNSRRTLNGAIINCRNKACIGNEKQELAHLLQGKESELLHIVIEQYQDSMLLLQHDGFALSSYVDPREIEAEISYQTGIEMPVTYEILSLLKKS
jgi:hypothetical protein